MALLQVSTNGPLLVGSDGRPITITVEVAPPPPTAPTLTLVSLTGQTAGGTTTAALTFANGAPVSLTATYNGNALTISGINVTVTAGSGATASGTAAFQFVTPPAGSYAILARSTGTYAVDSNALTLSVAPPTPLPALVLNSVSGQNPGGTSTANLTFANGAPDRLAVTAGGVALPFTSVTTQTSGNGNTAAGTIQMQFTTPATAGTYSIQVSSIGSYPSSSNSVTLVVLAGDPPPPDWTPYVPPTGGNATATLTYSGTIPSHRVFRRDFYSGNPPGFNTQFNRGWGKVHVPIKASVQLSALFMRLHNAEAPSAVATTPGTGTVAHPVVQVPGVSLVSATANSIIDLTVPAGDVLALNPIGWYYIDLGADAAMTHPIRIPVPVGVGALYLTTGTSHNAGITGPYAYVFGGPNNGSTPPTAGPWAGDINLWPALPSRPGDPGVSPYGVCWLHANSTFINNYAYRANQWQRPGDIESPYVTTAAPTFLNRCIAQQGVVCALLGFSNAGGTLPAWGAPNGGFYRNFLEACNQTLDSAGKVKVDGAFYTLGGNDANADLSLGGHGIIVTKKRLRAFLDAIDALSAAPIPTVLSAFPQSAGTTFATSDLNWLGYRQNVVEVAAERNAALGGIYTVAQQGAGLYHGYGAHGTMLGRITEAETFYRKMMWVLGPSKGGLAHGAGPRVVSAVRTGAIIDFTLVHDGGTALDKWNEDDDQTGVTSNVRLFEAFGSDVPDNGFAQGPFHIYPAGQPWQIVGGVGSTTKKVLNATTPAQITGANTIRVTLNSDPGASTRLEYYTMLTADGSGTMTGQKMFTDNYKQTATDGMRYGRDMYFMTGPGYIAPPTPGTQAVAINAPGDVVAGQWMSVSGPAGTGDPASGVELQLSGGTWNQPSALVMRLNNSHSSFTQAPASGTGLILAVRRTGQVAADAGTTFNVVSARNALPSTSRNDAIAWFDALNCGTLWQDIAGTIPITDQSYVANWSDALGTAGNVLTQPTASLRPFHYLRQESDPRANSPRWDDRSIDRPVLWCDGMSLISAANAPMVSVLNGDFTIFLVHRPDANPNHSIDIGASIASGPRIYLGWNNRPEGGRAGPGGAIIVARLVSGSSPTTIHLKIAQTLRYNSSAGLLRTRVSAAGVLYTEASATLTDLAAITTTFAKLTVSGATRFYTAVLFGAELSDAAVADMETWDIARYGAG